MRRVLVLVVTVSALFLALAAPAAAAAPVKQSGTVQDLFSFSTACTGSGQQTCTDTNLSSFPVYDEQGNVDLSQQQVCLDLFTYTISRGTQKFVGDESGCTTTDPSVLTVSSNLTTTLASTSIDLFTTTCTRRGCTTNFSRTVTVSASDTLVGMLQTFSGHAVFTQNNCTYRQTFSGISGEVAGTLTISGSTFDESGFADSTTFKVSVSCK